MVDAADHGAARLNPKLVEMPQYLSELIARADEYADRFAFDPTDAVVQVPATDMAPERAAYRRGLAERQLAEEVAAARSAGMSWREIGEHVGTSGEAAR